MKNICWKFALLSFCMCVSLSAFSQSREYIRNAIEGWGSCRNVAITKTNGDIALNQTNAYAYTNCPQGLANAIKELHSEEVYIDDIQLTENGRWIILHGDNGFRWSNIPYSLEQKIREFNNNSEIVTSVTLNDANDWIIISTEHYSASSDYILNWLKEGAEKYGALWAACVTNDAMVAVYEDGYKFWGNVPESLKSALRDSDLNVYRIKIAGTAWFFADKEGNYRYNM